MQQKRRTQVMSVPRFTISSKTSFSKPSIHRIPTPAVVERTGAIAALASLRREGEERAALSPRVASSSLPFCVAHSFVRLPSLRIGPLRV